jgi:hypothetical protein
MKRKMHIFNTIVLLIVSTVVSFAQVETPCSAINHQVFGDPSLSPPVVLKRLGTSPQFGEIPKHTAAAAYSHLKKVHTRNSRNSRKEIDDLLKGLGYSGFNDPSFSASSITPEILAAGRTGWMGAYYRGHKYRWSVLGRDFETFKLTSKDGSCYVYIMKKCGNAFYDPSTRVKATPLAAVPKAVCKTQTLNFSGSGKAQGGDVLNTKKDIPVVAVFEGKSLCLGTYSVPVRTTYEYTASADASHSKVVEVCDYGTGVVSPLNLNLPISLLFNVTGQDVVVGTDGKITLNINAKQYKSLKKVYAACSAESSTTSSTSAPAFAKKSENTTASEAAAAGTGNPGDCVKQTLNISGKASVEDVSDKSETEEVTLIGSFKKTGKLRKGELADKYICLGTYSVPAKSSLQYKVNGEASTTKYVEVCNTGSTKPVEDITLPVNLKSSFTKQDVTVGDYGRVYVALTPKQAKKLSKVFKRCCSDGSTSSKCY